MDSHDNKVCDESWDLYRYVVKKAPPFMTIVERTGGFPQFNALNNELVRASETVNRGPPLRGGIMSALAFKKQWPNSSGFQRNFGKCRVPGRLRTH